MIETDMDDGERTRARARKYEIRIKSGGVERRRRNGVNRMKMDERGTENKKKNEILRRI